MSILSATLKIKAYKNYTKNALIILRYKYLKNINRSIFKGLK